MAFLRRSVCALLVALPFLLAAPASAATRLVTTDATGAVRDRTEPGPFSIELVVRLSSSGPIQLLRKAGAILDVLIADIDHDGESDLVATARGRHHIRLFIWTNAGGRKLVSRQHRIRRGLARDSVAPRGAAKPVTSVADDDPCGDSCRSLVLASSSRRGQSNVSVPVSGTDPPLAADAGGSRRSPRGPPSTLPLL